jgi:hypothetical protein
MLDLYRATGRDDRGRNQRDHVTGAACEHPRRGQRARAGGSAGRGTPGSRATAAAEPEHLGQHAERAERRRQRRKPPAHSAQLTVEVATAVAVAHVPTGGAAGTDAAVVGERQLPPDL